MTSDLLKLAGASAIALMLTAAPAAAQDDYSSWDANGDAAIDQNEFGTNFGDAGIFDGWDADDSGDIAENEFDESRFGEDGVFSDWDANDDSALSDDEFGAGAFSLYDEDESGAIEEPEFGDLNDDMGDEGFWDV